MADVQKGLQMEFNLEQLILLPDGSEFPVAPDEDLLTLRQVLGKSLYMNVSSDGDTQKPVSWEQAVIRRKLSVRIFEADTTVELSSEEIVMIKRLMEQAFPVMVVAHACEMLNSPLVIGKTTCVSAKK